MKRFMIERDISGASDFTQEDLADISKRSNAAAVSLGVPYHWVTSYVAGDKVYCVHEAGDEETIREHSRRGGFPVSSVTVVVTGSFAHRRPRGVIRGVIRRGPGRWSGPATSAPGPARRPRRGARRASDGQVPQNVR